MDLDEEGRAAIVMIDEMTGSDLGLLMVAFGRALFGVLGVRYHLL